MTLSMRPQPPPLDDAGTASPLVSCIMPTRNRRRFAGQAIWYFLRQDYARRELVVVDDGEDAVEDLIPADDRIRYVRLDARRTIGAKRNLACECSRGQLIAHWDDDDWMAPHRLRIQVGALSAAAGRDVCGSGSLLHYDVGGGRAWRYRPAPGDPPWLAGCTLVYRRSAWAANGFADTSDGEDAAFVGGLDPARLLALDDDRFYVAVLHGGNAGAKNLGDRRWEPAPLDEVASRIGHDRGFYASFRGRRPSGRGAQAGSRPGPRSDRITVAAPFVVYDGYGSMAEYLVRSMVRAGAAVDVVATALDPDGLSTEFTDILARSRPERGAPVLCSAPVGPVLDQVATEDLFVHTMWETSRLPAGWVAPLNRARAVIVPATFLVDVLRASGVVRPVEVVPEGVDPDVYRFVPRPDRLGLTTLVVATPVGRKHVREAVAAWALAFEGDADARLIVKSRFGIRGELARDDRILVAVGNEPSRGILDWYCEADVLLALGNEGFGLPMIEGMATGLPVIALDAEGQADACREARDLVLAVAPAGWEQFDEAPYGPCGVRAVPAVAVVAERLRWVASHRDEARAMGRAASAWAVRHRDVWHKGPAVLDVVERHLTVPRPLRRTRAVMVPSLGTACGIAEYSRDLVSAMGTTPVPVRLTRGWPDPRGLRVLHVQQEAGILADVELDRALPGLVRAGVPVVVTEHTVDDHVRAWEREADVLVAMTVDGAARLGARWPSKQVERIPHGCHTWFPARKRERGRVVGAFGFLERHKGFERLLDVLVALPGTELLLFSHTRRPAEDFPRLWAQRAAGLPVRRVADYLPVAEVARRLAAEADVLAFWYDDIVHASASGAVRVGLATGVPIVASRTSWFDELSGVTHQPDDLVGGVERLLEDTPLRDELVTAARDYCEEHRWARVASRHVDLWRGLEAA